jgi:predicted dehydrogenase
VIGVGVIGCGYWGPNLVRNFATASGARLLAACDLKQEPLDQIGARWPGIVTTRDAAELLSLPGIDAVAIATPVATHYDLAMRALAAGKHVLVEKPLAASSELASRLIDEAARRRLVLMVDHTYIYSGAVQRIRDALLHDGVGEILYYDSVRINLGLFKHDMNVLWDLAVHDLAIMDCLLPARPCAVSASGARHVPGGPENIAYLTLFFDSTLIAHIHANWLAPVKVRHTLIGGTEKMIVYNDLEPVEKVKIYDRGITVTDDPERIRQLRIGYRSGDMWAPRVDTTEALRTEIDHFVNCIDSGCRPQSDGEAGLRVVRILEAATRSIGERGRAIDIE